MFEQSGGEWERRTKLTPDDGHGGDSFGSSVAVSDEGSTVLIGASNDDTPNGEYAGSAYVFERTDGSWDQRIQLTADDAEKAANFGSAVALANNSSTAVIGASNDDTSNGLGSGSAYVFERTDGSWAQRAKLVADDGDRNDDSVTPVVVSTRGPTPTPGADGDSSSNDSAAGSRHEANDETDTFGTTVAISSDASTVIIGANGDNNSNGVDAGSVYVFERTDGSWAQQTKLTADDSTTDDLFGTSVALSNDGSTAFVGARNDETPADTGPGSVYVFERTDGSWAQQTKLLANDDAGAEGFGNAVATSGDGTTTIIGAFADNHSGGGFLGSAFLFARSNGSWAQQTKLIAEDGDNGDFFGRSVALSNDGSTAVMGAVWDERPNDDGKGSVYVFDAEE